MNNVTEPTRSILVIEPNHTIRETLLDFLNPKYECEEADCIGIAFEKIGEKAFEIVLSNFDLQDTNALELLTSIQFLSPETTVILLSENDSAKNVIDAFRAGAFDFIQKPFELEELEDSIERAIVNCKTKRLKESYDQQLEELVVERNERLDKALKDIENSYRTTLKALIQALETRDCETHGHSERVVTFSLRLAHEIGLEKKNCVIWNLVRCFMT